jgi:hypothetical protein
MFFDFHNRALSVWRHLCRPPSRGGDGSGARTGSTLRSSSVAAADAAQGWQLRPDEVITSGAESSVCLRNDHSYTNCDFVAESY